MDEIRMMEDIFIKIRKKYEKEREKEWDK